MVTLSEDILPKGPLRGVTAYNDLVASGWDKDQAAFLCAMSEIETNYLILMHRTDATVFPTASCFPTCIRCALEADYNTVYTELGPVTLDVQTQGIVIDPDWYSDDAGMAILKQSLGIIEVTDAALADGKTHPWVHQLTPGEWNQTNQLGFEWALINKKFNLLKQWDMGPINMRCPGMGPVADAIGWKQVTGFPTSQQDMFDLYISQDYPSAFNSGAKWWLPPVWTGGYPSRTNPDSDLLARIAGRQLGIAATDQRAISYGSSIAAALAAMIAAGAQ